MGVSQLPPPHSFDSPSPPQASSGTLGFTFRPSLILPNQPLGLSKALNKPQQQCVSVQQLELYQNTVGMRCAHICWIRLI